MHKNYSQSNCILECSIRYARSMMNSNETNECTRDALKKYNDTSNEVKETKGCAPWFYPTSNEYYANLCDPWDTKLFQCYQTFLFYKFNVPVNNCSCKSIDIIEFGNFGWKCCFYIEIIWQTRRTEGMPHAPCIEI